MVFTYLFCLFIIFPVVYDLALLFKLEEKIVVIRREPKESFIPSFKFLFFVKANECFCLMKHSGIPDPSLGHRSRVGMVYTVIHLPVEAQRWLHVRFAGGHGSEAEYTFTVERGRLQTL